jgi:hypothetical protein
MLKASCVFCELCNYILDYVGKEPSRIAAVYSKEKQSSRSSRSIVMTE